HVVRRGIAGSGALVGQGGLAGRRVAVFDPLVEITRGVPATICGEIRLSADQVAKVHEFVGAELIGIVLGRPVRGFAQKAVVDPEIGPAWTVCSWGDALTP